MKFGKTKVEREEALEAKAEKLLVPRKKFVIIPRWCYNTDRYVWLETVWKTTHQSNYKSERFYNMYKEII
jgi:hypothetical protein